MFALRPITRLHFTLGAPARPISTFRRMRAPFGRYKPELRIFARWLGALCALYALTCSCSPPPFARCFFSTIILFNYPRVPLTVHRRLSSGFLASGIHSNACARPIRLRSLSQPAPLSLSLSHRTPIRLSRSCHACHPFVLLQTNAAVGPASSGSLLFGSYSSSVAGKG